MRRTVIVLAVLLVAGSIPTTAAAAGADGAGIAQQGNEATTLANETTTNETSANETNGTSPGQLLSGTIAVQDAEIDGDVESRAYGIAVARAATANARADVVADRLNATEQRLETLESERDRLNESRTNGSVGETEYRTRMAVLATELRTVDRTLNESENATGGLPAELLEERGVDASAIETLRNTSGELSGGEVAEIARSVGGTGPAAARGPPSEAGGAGGNASRGDRGDVGAQSAGRGDADNRTAGEDRRPDAVGNRTTAADNESGGNATAGGADAGGADGAGGTDRAGGADGTDADSDDDTGAGSADRGDGSTGARGAGRP